MARCKLFAVTAKSIFAAALILGTISSCGKKNDDGPTVGPAVPGNSVVFDDNEMPVVSAEISKKNLNNGDYLITLYLSSDKKDFVVIEANAAAHDGNDISLTKKETAHDGFYAGVSLFLKGRNVFVCNLGPKSLAETFKTGTLYVKKLEEAGENVFKISVNQGSYDDRNIEGNVHVFAISFEKDLTLLDDCEPDGSFTLDGEEMSILRSTIHKSDIESGLFIINMFLTDESVDEENTKFVTVCGTESEHCGKTNDLTTKEGVFPSNHSHLSVRMMSGYNYVFNADLDPSYSSDTFESGTLTVKKNSDNSYEIQVNGTVKATVLGDKKTHTIALNYKAKPTILED